MTHEAKRDMVYANLQKRIKNQNYLVTRLKDQQMGIEPVQALDIRSTEDQLNDDNLQFKQMRERVYELFGNDEQYSELFLSEIQNARLDTTAIATVWDQLVKMYQGKRVHPSLVLSSLITLVDRLESTGLLDAQQQQQYQYQSSSSSRTPSELDEIHILIDSMKRTAAGKKETLHKKVDALINVSDLLYVIPSTSDMNMAGYNKTQQANLHASIKLLRETFIELRQIVNNPYDEDEIDVKIILEDTKTKTIDEVNAWKRTLSSGKKKSPFEQKISKSAKRAKQKII